MVGVNKNLLESLLKALRRISTKDCENFKELVFKCLEALKLLSLQDVEDEVTEQDLLDIDVFTPILGSNELENRLDIAAIYLAYFSVQKRFHFLIANSINFWRHLIPAINSLDAQNRYKPGFLTVLSRVEGMCLITPEVLSYTNLNLGYVLKTSWIPLWLYWLEAKHISLAKISPLDESVLDFYIATEGIKFIEHHIAKEEKDPLSYHVYNVCHRMARFPHWVPHHVRKPAVQLVSPVAAKTNDLSFDVQVIMEVVDHPEMNLFETPHLCFLLSLALKKIRQTPCDVLHITLGSMGSVQSLPALFNMALYSASKLLINSNNTFRLINKASPMNLKTTESKWYHSKLGDLQIPSWFETLILSSVPPLAKSTFVYGDNAFETRFESSNILTTSDMLLESLNLLTLTSSDMLKRYQSLGLNPLGIDFTKTAADHNISHKAAQTYLDPFYIAIVMNLSLSNQYASIKDEVIEGSQIWGRLLSVNSKMLCEQVIKTHGNIALFYLIQFVSKVSLDDLAMQKVAIDLLHYLFFHVAEDTAKKLLMENVLTKQALSDYIRKWNDGSELYEPFSAEILEEGMSTVGNGSMSIDDLILLLPDGSRIIQRKEAEKKKMRSSHGKQYEITLAKDSTRDAPAKSTKYNNASSAAPFIPATKPARTLASYVKVKTSNYAQITPINDWGIGELNSSTTRVPMAGHDLSLTSHSTDNSFELANYSKANFETVLETSHMTSSSLFSSPWDASPDTESTPNVSKIVSTGKNYILGGHSRVKNNSRAQSIHIDRFEHEDRRT